jgi:hypothetical protein
MHSVFQVSTVLLSIGLNYPGGKYPVLNISIVSLC